MNTGNTEALHSCFLHGNHGDEKCPACEGLDAILTMECIDCGHKFEIEAQQANEDGGAWCTECPGQAIARSCSQ